MSLWLYQIQEVPVLYTERVPRMVTVIWDETTSNLEYYIKNDHFWSFKTTVLETESEIFTRDFYTFNISLT